MLSLPERITTERLILQRLRYEDAEEIFYTYASKPEATRFVSWPVHQSVDDTRQYLAFAIPAWAQGKEFSYTIRTKGEARLIGSIGVLNMESHLQFGYILSPTQWNRGFATEAVRQLLRYLTALPSVGKISTFVDVDNAASIRVLEKSGLRPEGVFPGWFQFPNQKNSWKDCVFYSLPTAAGIKK